MFRDTRKYPAGAPVHVIQHGHSREVVFFTRDDCRYYLDCLLQALFRYQVQLHAYVLMTNLVQLLMTARDETGIPRLLQQVSHDYAQHISGSSYTRKISWNEKNPFSWAQADDYLLTCMRYIEYCPVRAGLVASPGEYCWSSYRHHAFGETDRLLTDHEYYRMLGRTPSERQALYRELSQLRCTPLVVGEW